MPPIFSSPPPPLTWLSQHRQKQVVMSCRWCRYFTHFSVAEILDTEGTDIALQSLPGIISRLIHCKRATDSRDSCYMTVFRFVDPPAQKPQKVAQLPKGTYPLPDIPLAEVPLTYAVCAHCPCGWQKSVNLRKMAEGLPPSIKVSDVQARLVCLRCRNTKNNVLAFLPLTR